MEKKKYISPEFNIIRIGGESFMDNFNFGLGSQDSGDAEVKRYKPIIIDDEEDEEWEETTTAFSGRVFK